MAKYPTPFHHPREAMVLTGIGEQLVKRLEERLARHCKENGLPMPVNNKKSRRMAGAVPLTPVIPDEPKPKKPRKEGIKKPYIPQYRSGGFAILLALLEASIQKGSRSLTKEEIEVIGQKYSQTSLVNPEHGKFYNGFASAKTLINHGLVYQNGKGYFLTGEGRDMAEQLQQVAVVRDPSLTKYFTGTTDEDNQAIFPSNRGRLPSYSPDPHPIIRQPRPTPRNNAVSKRSLPCYDINETNDWDSNASGSMHDIWDDPDGDWGPSSQILPAMGVALESSSSLPVQSALYSSSSSRSVNTNHETFNTYNDWDDDPYDNESIDGSPQDVTPLEAKKNSLETLPDLSRAPMPVLLDMVEAQKSGTVSEYLNAGSLNSTSTRLAKRTRADTKHIPDSFPHMTLGAYMSTNDDGDIQDISQLAKFQPIYIKPGSFDIELILDIREVRVQSDPNYISQKLRDRGITVRTRALELGDVIWVARPREQNPLLPEEIVLDYIIERKRMDDLASSIKDGRFNEQKFRLSRSGIDNVIYLLETHKVGETYGIPGEAIRTAIASTQALDGFFVKRTANTDQTIDYLAAMTQALMDKYMDQVLYAIPDRIIDRDNYLELKEYLRVKSIGRSYLTSYRSFMGLNSKSDTLTVRDNFIKMLMVIRGVSAEKAVEIAKVYGTPRALFSAIDKPGAEATKDERRDSIVKSVSNFGRKKIGPALATKIMDLWYSDKYDDTGAPTYGS
ncbi:Crossover junction endonuclease mus81 [Linnemannia zychae]|nr:Crossover junction endonuclease mus81 [Linnemannia zychae]